MKINHNSSCDVHTGTAADCVFPLHNPRAYRLPAIQPPCGPRAKMLLKREILKGLKMTLLRQWVTATTESWLLLKTEAKCRDEFAALQSGCVGGFSSEVFLISRFVGITTVVPQVNISNAEYHGAAPLKLAGGTAELHDHCPPIVFLHACCGVTMPTMPVYARPGQNALLKSCEKYFHQDHSARAFPGSQHCVSRAQQAEEK